MRIALVFAVVLCCAAPALAQAADAPSLDFGATIFADYTVGSIQSDAFNVSRAYVNVNGSLNRRISFRVTPDVARESGSGGSLNGSQMFRLKYAFAQLALDDWTTKGSWIRLGVQQTPLIDYQESAYRYRFQGTLFVEREGFLTSSDAGVSARWVMPNGYGDLHAGYYNGEGYSHAETNDDKALQIRASLRPLPRSTLLKGLRLTAFIDQDHADSRTKRHRVVSEVTFESDRVKLGAEALRAEDQRSAKGWSVWTTPQLGKGWELLLRHDDTMPDLHARDQKHRRDIAGLAYWIPNPRKPQTAIMIDYDRLTQPGLHKPDDRRYGLKIVVVY